jgi:hypothetical protein
VLSRKLVLQDLVQLFEMVVKNNKNFLCISHIEARISVINVIRVEWDEMNNGFKPVMVVMHVGL